MEATTPNLSIFALFGEADLFVKAIMLLLFGLSIMSWALWFSKSRQMAALRRKGHNFEEAFLSGEDLESLYANTRPEDADHPMAKVFVVGLQEWQESQQKGEAEDNALRVGILNRIRRRMDATLTRELEQCESWMPFLATVGSTAPFIGLLGTVWGIMNAFTSISAAKNTSLAIVAPGIAEALLATALGLFAAIPAVVAYNRIATQLSRYTGRLEAFATEFLALLEKREEDRQQSVKKIKAVK
ncbi:MAG: protein TolQ [Alphaproteobacteria bacterium]|nr:protein TolQ [Alphaproteobacteria bacterium]MDD9920519.1 protein TolQ [Alphaproteobacteria bacterium]